MEKKQHTYGGEAGALFDEAPCGYLDLDQGGRIIAVNKTLLDWLGYRKEEVVSRLTFPDLLHTDGKSYYETHHFPLEQSIGHVEEVSYDLIGKNGDDLPVLVTSRRVALEGADEYYYRYLILNTTERREYERQLLEAKKEAEATSRAKDVFLARVSHEIRTPVHAVLSIADFLSETALSSEQQTLLNTLRFSANTLLDFIDEVSDLSRLDAGGMEPHAKDFQLDGLCQQLIRHTRIMLRGKPVEVFLSIDPEIPGYLRGDYVKLRQILNNLLLNAVKFTEEGTITLAVELKLSTAEYCLLEFSVVDTGIGIAPTQMNYLFEPFAQADQTDSAQPQAAGLGLAISKQLIALLGGELQVESEVGRGSNFSFTLRFDCGTAPLDSEVPRDLHEYSLRGVQILLVEDNHTNIYIAARILREQGATVDIAENGKAALELAARAKYDIVLMDLQMPILDGYAATRRLRYLRDHAHTPVIALTAAGIEEVKTQLREAGMNDFLMKPFRADQLLRTIQRYCLPGKSADRVNETGRAAPLDSSIDPENLYDLIGPDDPEGTKELVEAMQEDLGRQVGALSQALVSRDGKQLRTIRHALQTVIRLTKPQPLTTLLEESADFLSTEPKQEELERRAQHLDRALKTAIDDLSRLVMR